MIIENWKDIKNYEGFYQVSNLGRVKSLQRIRKGRTGSTCVVKERILKSKINKYGYVCYSLSKDSKMKYFTAHRLVAQAFIPNPDNKPQIDHIDGNKLNNTISNLRWATNKENRNNPITRKVLCKPIYCNGTYYESIRDCARKLNTTGHSIRYCIKNNTLFRNQYSFNYA